VSSSGVCRFVRPRAFGAVGGLVWLHQSNPTSSALPIRPNFRRQENQLHRRFRLCRSVYIVKRRFVRVPASSVIPKSGNHFSEKITRKDLDLRMIVVKVNALWRIMSGPGTRCLACQPGINMFALPNRAQPDNSRENWSFPIPWAPSPGIGKMMPALSQDGRRQ